MVPNQHYREPRMSQGLKPSATRDRKKQMFREGLLSSWEVSARQEPI
jgi:hypothetical protein